MTINNKYSYQCVVCKKEMITNIKNKKMCSEECVKIRFGRFSTGNNIPAGTVGAVAELAVATDLMIKGYSVFRALSPSCFCDLLAIKDKEFKKIEVRTGYIKTDGKVFYPKNISKNNGTPNEYGIYVNAEKSVYYFPVLEGNKQTYE